ncbi:hypothetical protein PIROE2DRAFT_15765 [Piromyces sp. E2]|nr:hypothetical protein PIROE2DRAFT_15765 [Piromyces sp. E2]|eukprot:OUM58865.1 hypothetical protein PIROE2DRAFT_15765 [Piromyces sp. E2]
MENVVNYEISETNRGKKQIIIDRKYKFNFSYKKVDNSKIYRWTHYKTDYKCKSFITLNDKNKIIKYHNNHNHIEEDYNATMSLLKHEINKSSRDETSLVRDEDFMIFKNPNVVIFQSPFQAKIYSQYCEDIFVDGTFSTGPKFGYQVFNKKKKIISKTEKINNLIEEYKNMESVLIKNKRKYPVVFIDFDKLEIRNGYAETINNFKYIIQEIYSFYESIVYEKLSEFNKKKWHNFMESETNNNNFVYSISFLCNCIKKVLNKKVVLLIDHYDTPILNAFNTEFYDELYSFYKKVFMYIFNEDRLNSFLFKTFITGKFFISFLKNVSIINYGVMNNKYNEFYSITDSELKKLLSELKLENKFDEKFEEYCTDNIYSYINSTVINNTNILISSSFFNSIATTNSITNADTITSATTTTNTNKLSTSTTSTTNNNTTTTTTTTTTTNATYTTTNITTATTNTTTTTTTSTNTVDDNIVNIYNSSSNFHINTNNYNYNNNIIKCYDLFYIKQYIENILISNKEYNKKYNKEYVEEDETSKNFILIQKVFNVFKNFDYLIINDMNYLLQNGYIENRYRDVDMSSKNNINNKLEHFIWKLLIESGYLIFDYANKGLKIRNKAMEIFIKEKFFEWKNCLYNKYRDIINSFIINFDEEKIKEFLEDSVKNIINQNIFLDRYYDIIVALLSLNNKYIVITKNNSNERHDIRELLMVNKKYLDIFKNSNSSSNIKNDNSNYNENTNNKIDNSNSNDNKDKDNRSEKINYSYIIYITIKSIIEPNRIENGCILALEDNENFKFDDKELKNLYDKIIKFGIAFYNNHCDVNYDINYGINFKRIEMSKELYSGENYNRFDTNKYYFIDKTKMISSLIGQFDSVFLITRPRRFGKSLNLRMIKEFFEKPNNRNNNEIDTTFDGLEISKDRKNMREFHRYPILILIN